MIKFLSALILLLVTTAAQAERIRDLTSVQGVRQNSLIGYGLVVGLDGTGDQTTQTPFTTQTLNNMLSQLGITVPTGTNMQLKNVAAVMVTASLPPFGRQGQTIDVVVSSMGNAKSLRGGTLLMTPLKGVDSQVYALAQGNILVGGAGASAGGSSVQVNQLNGGRITNGAVIERELPSQFGVGNTLNLQLNDEDFSMAQQIADTINRVRGYGSATALDARTIQVRVPSGNSSQVRFLADIQNMQVNVTPQDAKVVINSRTGSVVMNREVTLDSSWLARPALSSTLLITFICISKRRALAIMSLIAATALTLLPSRTPDITRKVGSACSTGPRVAWVSALKRKMPSSPRCTSLPVAFTSLRRPTGATVFAGSPGLSAEIVPSAAIVISAPSGTAIGPASPITGCP